MVDADGQLPLFPDSEHGEDKTVAAAPEPTGHSATVLQFMARSRDVLSDPKLPSQENLLSRVLSKSALFRQD